MTTETMYGLDLISRSLRLLGVLGINETATGPQAAQGLDKLKALIDYLRLKRLTISSVVRTVQTLTINVASYTIGPGAVWNMDRPVWIDGAALLPFVGENREVPVKVLTHQEYREFTDKGRASAYPTRGMFYDKDFNSAGQGTIVMMETPSVTGLRLALYLPTSGLNVQSLNNTIYRLEPGWSLMIEYNLARLLADNYPGTWTQKQENIAVETLTAIMRPNDEPGKLRDSSPFTRFPNTCDILLGP